MQKKRFFTTSDVGEVCHHSRETAKRWVQEGRLKAYRVGKSGHWRILAKDLALFMSKNRIPFPEADELGVDLKSLANSEEMATVFCWEFHKDKRDFHVRPHKGCEECIVYRVKAINCYTLREEVGHRKIHCMTSCEECEYSRFQSGKFAPG